MCVAHNECAPSAKHVSQGVVHVRGFMCLVVVPNWRFLLPFCWVLALFKKVTTSSCPKEGSMLRRFMCFTSIYHFFFFSSFNYHSWQGQKKKERLSHPKTHTHIHINANPKPFWDILHIVKDIVKHHFIHLSHHPSVHPSDHSSI
jgi:hypothetical protein